MTQTIAHVVFTPSGAGCLRSALKHAGRDDEVIACFDNLSFGPINPADPSLRSEWVENELGWTEWQLVTAQSQRVWDDTRCAANRKIAWLSRRSTMEYANFLEWLWRHGDARPDGRHGLAPAGPRPAATGDQSGHASSRHHCKGKALGFGRAPASQHAHEVS